MPNQNLISETIPATVVTAVEDHLNAAIAALKPYGVTLTKDQRSTLFKMGDGSTNIADKLSGYLRSNPEFTPSYVDKAKFDEDYAIPQQLKTVHSLSEQLFQLVDDTVMAAGSDIMDVGMSYYHSVRNAAHDGAAGAKAIYDDLKMRFPGRPRQTAKASGGNSK